MAGHGLKVSETEIECVTGARDPTPSGCNPRLGGARPCSGKKPVQMDGMLKVPDGPGLGVTVNEAALKEARMPGEPWWD